MTPSREDIIRMAREVGFQTGIQDYATGNGSFPFIRPIGETCLVEVENLVQAAYAAGAAAGAATEREAICDIVDWELDGNGHAEAIKIAIQARGNK